MEVMVYPSVMYRERMMEVMVYPSCDVQGENNGSDGLPFM